jgi:futalosine hydrolase
MSYELILIPTAVERAVVESRLIAVVADTSFRIELCGFGPIAAAARTAELIARKRPRRVILVGIAGTYDERIPVGTACGFENVSCFGIGAGSGETHESAAEMGWAQWSGVPSTKLAEPIEISDSILLSGSSKVSRKGTLVTCCSASGNARDVTQRLAKYPESTAEDMEGFAVAMACKLASIPCEIVRGISNIAGDRDITNWKIKAALDAATTIVAQLLATQV